MSSRDATASICPKGWKLPSGGTGTGSYKGLTDAASIDNSYIGSTKISSAPYSFTYAGYYIAGLDRQGSYGYYWSRSAYTSATYAYDFFFTPSAVYQQNNSRKYSGFSVRCIFTGS